MTKTYEWLRSTKLTPLQLIYVFVAVIAFIFMATDIFKALPDIIRVLIYGSTIVVGVLLGVSLVNIKKLASEMKAIYEDSSMSTEQKINAYGNLALQVLYKLGEAWDLFHTEQFEQAKQEKIDDLTSQIAELQRQLDESKGYNPTDVL